MLSLNKKNLTFTLLIFFILLNFCFINNTLLAKATVEDTIHKNVQSDLKWHAEELGYQKENKSISSIIITIVSTALTFLGIIFFLIILFSGLQWMTAEGNEDKVLKSKETIKNAVIGLAVVLCAYGITKFIISPVMSMSSQETTQNTNQTN